MVVITGNFLGIALPEASAGSIRSPRRMTPSSIGIASSCSTTVFGYCSPRGFQAAALAVLPAEALVALFFPAAFGAVLVLEGPTGAEVEDPVLSAAEPGVLAVRSTPATAAKAPAVRVRVATEAAVSRVSVRIEWFLPVCREINESPRREVTEP